MNDQGSRLGQMPQKKKRFIKQANHIGEERTEKARKKSAKESRKKETVKIEKKKIERLAYRRAFLFINLPCY